MSEMVSPHRPSDSARFYRGPMEGATKTIQQRDSLFVMTTSALASGDLDKLRAFIDKN